MKTITLLITVTFSTLLLPLRSQDIDAIMKGKRVVGGGIALSWTDDELETDAGSPDRIQTVEFNSFSFRPYAGKFIRDRLLIGGGPIIYSESREFEVNDPVSLTTTENDQFDIGLSVFVRKYYPIIGKFGAFFQPGADLRILSSESKSMDFDNTSQEVISESLLERDGFQATAGINLGLYVFLGERFSLESNLGNISVSHVRENRERSFSSTSAVSEEDREVNRFNLNLVNQISFDQLFVINYFF